MAPLSAGPPSGGPKREPPEHAPPLPAEAGRESNATRATPLIRGRATALRAKLDAEAKERQKRKPAKSVVENLPPQNSDSEKTRDRLGKAFGVSGKTVDHARRVVATVPSGTVDPEGGKVDGKDGKKRPSPRGRPG